MTSKNHAAPAVTRVVRVLLVAAAAGGAPSAFAQTMYRCGSSFQDHPCAAGQAGVALGSGAAPRAARGASSTASASPSVRCTQRGVAAQQISWMREAGKTEQEQAATAGPDKRDLVAEVYGRHGSSVEVRAAIEADCAAREARAAELAAAGIGVPAIRSDAIEATAPQPAPAPAAPVDNNANNAANRKKAMCKSLNDERDTILARQRNPNHQSAAEALRQQYRDVNDRLREAGC